MGSIAPLRLLNQRTFDQLFIWLASLIFEGPLWGLPRRACGVELRLLRLDALQSRAI